MVVRELVQDMAFILDPITNCECFLTFETLKPTFCRFPYRNAAKPVQGRVTNNVGEIQAAIHAIKTALDLGIEKLAISTDSQFLINSITLWVAGWKRRDWKLKNNQPVKNVVDFKELDELLQNKSLKVKWVSIVNIFINNLNKTSNILPELCRGP